MSLTTFIDEVSNKTTLDIIIKNISLPYLKKEVYTILSKVRSNKSLEVNIKVKISIELIKQYISVDLNIYPEY